MDIASYLRHFSHSEGHLPPGFRFHPTDEELITSYLLKKVLDSTFTGRAISEVDLNKCEPWQLPGKAKMGEKEWYFFTLRDRKYPTGLRTNRATAAGYWKATGKDKEIYSTKTSALVGMKKTLVFYRGRAPKGEKTNWIMHEYRLEGKLAYHYLSSNSKDEWVISRVYQKSGSGSGAGGGASSSGVKKTKVNSSNNSSSLYPEPSSPSIVSLPALLDHTTAAATAASAASCSDLAEHVPCFSTIAASNVTVNAFNHLNFDPTMLPPPPTPPLMMTTTTAFDPISMNMGMPAFPSLRSLQENLQMPYYFPLPPAPPTPAAFPSGSSMMWGSIPENGAAGASELDSMWTF